MLFPNRCRFRCKMFLCVLGAFLLCASSAADEADRGWRNIRYGTEIPSEDYADQPYIVIAEDGSWVCTLTTGRGEEWQGNQHVVAAISGDLGRTWSDPVDIEPATGPEASWVVPLATRFGRIYGFYTYNGDNVRVGRSDTHGWYAYKYSDDGGRTWSRETYRLPMRLTACDLDNGLPEGVIHFWGICKPIVVGDEVYFAFTKLSRHFLEDGEGWLFRSDNVLTEKDPSRIRWGMLPDGEHGIRNAAFGSVQEEHNVVALSDGSLYCVYRTTLGFPAVSYSRDDGRTWCMPEPMTYGPHGRVVRNPRACPRVWRCGNGRFLFWYHNHGGKDFRSRNPVWISGGIEKSGTIHWSEPEILLYDDNVDTRMSYPDLIEQNGRYWFTETQKTVARVHEIPAAFLDTVWNQGEDKRLTTDGVLLALDAQRVSQSVRLPPLPDLAKRGGFSIDLWFELSDLSPGQILLSSRDDSGKGIALLTGAQRNLQLVINDGKRSAVWSSDPGLLKKNTLHHVVFTVDGGPRIISVVVDGKLCDGGSDRQYGWGRFPADMSDVTGSGTLNLSPTLKSVRIYSRYLMTSEAVANYHAGCGE